VIVNHFLNFARLGEPSSCTERSVGLADNKMDGMSARRGGACENSIWRRSVFLILLGQ
jgi:hypothetical protein